MKIFATGSALVALIAATPALAQEPTREDLAELVRAQAAEIASLRQRVEKLEAGATSAQAPPALAAAPQA
ncbi:porin, partial [Novosphingobium sp. ZW T3_23]